MPKLHINEENQKRIEEMRRLFNARQYEPANHLARKTLNEIFDEPNSLYVAAHYLIENHAYGLAQAIYRTLVERFPDRQEAWNQLGRCYQEGHDPDMAYAMFRRSLQMKPRNFPALNNLGLIHINRCEPEEAISMTAKALRLECTEAERVEAIENMALGYLALRKWEKGFALAEQSMGFHESRKERIYGNEPRWAGEPDQTIVTYGEQGLGDEIAFASCVPDLVDHSRQVIVDCAPMLEGLFRRSFPAAHVYGTRFKQDNDWPFSYEIDSRAAFSALPRYFRKTDQDFPGTAYLIADPERRVQWRALFDTLPGKKVGIAWNGGIQITGRVRRSLSLEQLHPILSQPGATFVSLEYSDASAAIDSYNKKTGVRIRQFPHATLTKDYDDVAAMVAELDLVISVQTAVVHLCGALGKECWLMTPPRPRWFYMGDAPTVPWYNSVQIYRYGDKWPIARLAKKLRDWLRA